MYSKHNQEPNLDIREIDSELKNMKNYENIFLGICSENVKRGRIKRHLDFITRLEKNKDIQHNSVILVFEGYENEKRELHDIPEIRNWVKRLVKNKPNIFYYLADYSETIFLLFLCLSKTKLLQSKNGIITNEVSVDRNLINKIINSAVAHSKRRGDSKVKQEEVELRILLAISRHLED